MSKASFCVLKSKVESQEVNSCCRFTWLTFNLHLRGWDWSEMPTYRQTVSHFRGTPFILYSRLSLFLHRAFVQFFHAALFSSSPTPPSSINQPPVSSTSSSSVDPLFMSFHPTLVLSLTVNACVSLRGRFQRQSYRGGETDAGVIVHSEHTKGSSSPDS